MIEVELPDGTIAEFPDGTSHDVIKGALSKYRTSPQPQTAQAPAQTDTASFWDRFTTGLGDPAYGIAQLLSHATGGPEAVQAVASARPDVPPSYQAKVPEPGDIDRQIMEREAAYQASAPEGFDWGRTLGGVAASLPVLAVPGGPIVGSAIGGGLASAAQPVTGGDYASEKAKQAGLGAAAGGAGGALMSGLSRAIFPKAVSRTSELRKAGVTPTVGQALGGRAAALESKATSIPVLGDVIAWAQRKSVEDFNRAMMAKAVQPVGGQAPKTVGRDAVAEVGERLGQMYDDLLPKLTFQVDNQLASEISTIRAMAGALPKTQEKRFLQIMRDQVATKAPNGAADGVTFKGIESMLSKHIRGYTSPTSSWDDRQLGYALQDVLNAMRGSLSRTNPEFGPQLQPINKAYSTFTMIKKASDRAGSKEGVFSPAAMRQVSKGRLDKETRALVDQAYDVLGTAYPDSGTAGRLMFPLLTGGLGYINPAAGVAAGMSALPYLPGGRQAALWLLAGRPAVAAPVAAGVRRLAPLSAPLAPMVQQNVP